MLGIVLDGIPESIVIGLTLLAGGGVGAAGRAAVAGYNLFAGAAPATVAAVLGFAGKAVLTMLADTMMPEAFDHGGRAVGLVTTLGLATAIAVDAWQ